LLAAAEEGLALPVAAVQEDIYLLLQVSYLAEAKHHKALCLFLCKHIQ